MENNDEYSQNKIKNAKLKKSRIKFSKKNSCNKKITIFAQSNFINMNQATQLNSHRPAEARHLNRGSIRDGNAAGISISDGSAMAKSTEISTSDGSAMATQPEYQHLTDPRWQRSRNINI
jgi:hypothetical protein